MLVVDASFLMAAFAEETHTGFAQSTLIGQQDRQKIAPALISWEFSNILWKKHRTGEFNDIDLADAGEFLSALEIEITSSLSPPEVGTLALFAKTHGLTAYDAAYLDLAVGHAAPLATTDRNMARAALAVGVVVYSPFA